MLRSFFRRSLAAVFSMLIPGSGQTFNRQPRKGLVILVLAALFVLIGGTLRLFSVFWGLVICVSFEVVFLVWTVVDSTVHGGLKAKDRPGFSKRRAVYLCAMVLIVVNGVGGGTKFYANYLLAGLGTRVDPSNSMSPTVQSGDRFVADVSYYRHRTPQRSEVILLLRDEPGQGTVDLVKRIIAIGGDTIEATENGVYLNGKRLDEPYARYNSPDASNDTKRVFGPVKVPIGNYFVMGDNRDDSYDSRYFGTVPLSRIEGRLLYLYWSRNRTRIGQVIH